MAEQFLNELLGYQKTAALKAAIELDLFSALAAADGDLGQVSERTFLRAPASGLAF